MTHISTVATPANETIDVAEPTVLYLDPDIAALFAEVDAILRRALDPALRPPAAPATGCPPQKLRSTSGPAWGELVRSRATPFRSVWAVQRSPPDRTTRDHDQHNHCGRQVMASQQT